MAAPKKILITGASGYVGQHLIASLAFRGISEDTIPGINSGKSSSNSNAGHDERSQYKLLCAYNSLPTFENDLNAMLDQSHLHPSIAGISSIPNVDFSQPNYIDVIQQAASSCCGEGEDHNNNKIDAIIHLAALSSPGFCENNAGLAWKVNCPLDMLALGAPMIYMSTDQVYEGTKQFYDEDKDETVPVNVYGRTKLAFERVLSLGADDGSADGHLLNEKELGGDSDQHMPDIKMTALTAAPKSVILRSSLILGPSTPLANGCKKGAFPSFLQFIESRLQSSSSTNYFANEFRSVVHVEDVIKSIKHFLLNALDEDSSPQVNKTGVFNLGGSTRASRYDMAMEVANHLKLDSSSACSVDRPDTVSGGVPSPPDISMNVEKITKELGVPKMNGLKETVACTFT